MMPPIPPNQPQADDARMWIGGEAAIAPQVGRHRYGQGIPAKYLLRTVLGLTFIGGLALGGVISWLCRTETK